MLQHAVGKAARRRADVRRNGAGEVDGKYLERFLQLEPTPAHKGHGVFPDRDHRIVIDLCARLGLRRAIDRHAALHDHGTGALTAARQP